MQLQRYLWRCLEMSGVGLSQNSRIWQEVGSCKDMEGSETTRKCHNHSTQHCTENKIRCLGWVNKTPSLNSSWGTDSTQVSISTQIRPLCSSQKLESMSSSCSCCQERLVNTPHWCEKHLHECQTWRQNPDLYDSTTRMPQTYINRNGSRNPQMPIWISAIWLRLVWQTVWHILKIQIHAI